MPLGCRHSCSRQYGRSPVSPQLALVKPLRGRQVCLLILLFPRLQQASTRTVRQCRPHPCLVKTRGQSSHLGFSAQGMATKENGRGSTPSQPHLTLSTTGSNSTRTSSCNSNNDNSSSFYFNSNSNRSSSCSSSSNNSNSKCSGSGNCNKSSSSKSNYKNQNPSNSRRTSKSRARIKSSPWRMRQLAQYRPLR